MTSNELIALEFQPILQKYKGLIGLLSSVYPNFAWKKDHKLFPSKQQQTVFNIATRIFTSQDIMFTYTHPHLLYDSTNRNVSFDMWIPSLSLALDLESVHLTSIHDPTQEEKGKVRT